MDKNSKRTEALLYHAKPTVIDAQEKEKKK